MVSLRCSAFMIGGIARLWQSFGDKNDDRAIDRSRIIQPPLLHTNQLQLIFDGKFFQIFTKQVKRLQLPQQRRNNTTPETMANETNQKQWLAISSTQTTCRNFYTLKYLSSSSQRDWVTDNARSASSLVIRHKTTITAKRRMVLRGS